jgi:hypothetical protein
MQDILQYMVADIQSVGTGRYDLVAPMHFSTGHAMVTKMRSEAEKTMTLLSFQISNLGSPCSIRVPRLFMTQFINSHIPCG